MGKNFTCYLNGEGVTKKEGGGDDYVMSLIDSI